MTAERRPHVLIIEQAVPMRHDRRLRMQAEALVRAGFRVSVIAPRARGDRSRQRVDGVDFYGFRAPGLRHGVLGLSMTAVYSWLRVAWLSLVVWRRSPFDVLQGGNPPDSAWALARLWSPRGVRFLYDQRDLGPERYLARFGLPRSPVGKLVLGTLRWLERRSYALADHVLVGNELCHEIAARRGGRDLEDSTVVRTAPDTLRERPVHPPAAIRSQGRHILVHLAAPGHLGSVPQLVAIMDELVFRRWRNDVHLVLLGSGHEWDQHSLDTMLAERGLTDYVTVVRDPSPTTLAHHLSAADLGLTTEPKTPLSDVTPSPTTLDYLAYCLPTVSYDLAEVHLVAGPAAVLVESGDTRMFADEIELLLADTERRVRLGLAGRDRVTRLFDWLPQSTGYVDAVDRLTEHALGVPGGAASLLLAAVPAGSVDPDVGPPVDLENPRALTAYLRDRGARAPGRASA